MPKRDNNLRPDFQAQLPRQRFDIGRRLVFTSSVGHILPIYHHLLNPSERVKGSCEIFSRTQPLVLPAFTEIDENIHFFFVPFPRLCTYFEQIAYGTNDFLSSAINSNSSKVSVALPLLRFNQVDSDWIDDFASGHDAAGDNKLSSAFRLFDCLGYNPNVFFKNGAIHVDPDSGESITYSIRYGTAMSNIFPYALLAYHAIYYDFFSNDDREKRQVAFYNWDKYWNNTYVDALSIDDTDFGESIFNLHYADYSPDYFQDVYPTPLISAMNMIQNADHLNLQIHNWLDNGSVPYVVDTSGNQSNINNASQVRVYPSSPSRSSVFRSAFALERYVRTLGKSAKTYDAQVLAHFGFKIPHDVKHEISYLGSYSTKIVIGEVLSTADTEKASVGDVAGKGYAKKDARHVFDFTAPVHGVLLGVAVAKPRVIYSDYGWEKGNAFFGFESLWNPAFDKLGVQPLFNYEVNADHTLNNMSDIKGWQIRYAERKKKYDKTSYAFFGVSEPGERPATEAFNDWISWLNGRLPSPANLSSSSSTTLSDFRAFKIKPSDLNNLFYVDFQYNTEWSWEYMDKPWLVYAGDPFIHDLKIYCELFSPMSKTGEPDMDL